MSRQPFPGGELLPHFVPVGRSRPQEPPAPGSELVPTGRTRRVLGRRLPVYTGYTGGSIPTSFEGTIRVKRLTGRGIVLILSTVVAAPLAVALADTRAILIDAGVYLVVNIVLGGLVSKP